MRTYALSILSGNGKLGTVGFCWGGGASFNYAIDQPALDAAVVYYGSSPTDARPYANVNAPVLGLYGGNAERVTATIPDAEAGMPPLYSRSWPSGTPETSTGDSGEILDSGQRVQFYDRPTRGVPRLN